MLERDVKHHTDKQQTKYGPCHLYTVHVKQQTKYGTCHIYSTYQTTN